MLKTLIAPIQLLFAPGYDHPPKPGAIAGRDEEGNVAPLKDRIEWYSPKGTVAYLTIGSLISLLLIVSGLYFALSTSDAMIEIKGAGIELKTNNLGFGFCALGTILYLLVGKIAVTKGMPQQPD